MARCVANPVLGTGLWFNSGMTRTDVPRTTFFALFGLVLLGGCGLTPEQQETLSKKPDPPGTVFLMSRSIEDDGILCKYSNGDTIFVRNIAAGCP